ncbi:geranyl transferase [Virgibacillus dokdonensis]|uniref:Farnesyl diphosphate synthase n=1 Tax=Virgibacillus dokdonensis TaxID=302167 RepID=A0A3E0WX01_9BACI|nr:farnesyl diphosphate synthase [Virgibacillus dokdonensis]RFA37338.1 geranyl transferase [Virgibacillus dokdonensis]
MEMYLEEKKQFIDSALTKYMQALQVPPALKQSMTYSVEAGGKRLRPILLLASYEAFQKDITVALSSAAALEMIHTYSLIHDDLPAMDDDDYRRGKLTNHKAFSEATAVLAGDALLTYSFEIISKDDKLTAVQKAELIALLAESSGPKGMVAGQILDMEAEDKAINLQELERVHTLKTGELLRYAVYAGAYLGGATEKQLHALQLFASYLGLIFQVQDDILDVTGDEVKLGKPVGSDALNLKSTYPKLLGIDGAIEKKEQYLLKAKESLQAAGIENSNLMDLAIYFGQRDY